MNEFRNFIVREMEERGWNQHTLAQRAGLSDKLISQLVRDTRPQLKEMPKRPTLEGLGRAFGMTPDAVSQIAAHARGVPVTEQVVVRTATGAPRDELLRELAARLDRAPAPPALDVIEDKAPRQLVGFLAQLRDMAEASRADGSRTLAAWQDHLADMLESHLEDQEGATAPAELPHGRARQ